MGDVSPMWKDGRLPPTSPGNRIKGEDDMKTMIVVERKRKGYICTCGRFWFLAPTIREALSATKNHRQVYHTAKGRKREQ